MSTFYDLQNRPHTLKEVDHSFTYLHSMQDGSEIKIANTFFSTIFKEIRHERVIKAVWPIEVSHASR